MLPDSLQPIRVAVVDGRRLVREAIALGLQQDAGLVVDTFGGIDAVLEDHGGTPWDVVLLDHSSPSVTEMEQVSRAVRLAAAMGARMMLITGQMTPELAAAAIDLGVHGVVPRMSSLRVLSSGIRLVQAGGIFVPVRDPGLPVSPVRGQPGRRLSPQETRVLRYLLQGMTNKEIAQAMALSEPTVKMHLSSLRLKLGARNRTQATMIARERGIV
jgi:two-component system, NarL family, nitrate/nitrite response regulator NarL